MMSVEPKCPKCGVATQWNRTGDLAVFCPTCLQVTAHSLCNEILFEFSLWLEAQNLSNGFLSYFNVVALGLFQHATQFRADFPDKSASESWEAFHDNPSCCIEHASDLFELIYNGQWPEVNAHHICNQLHAIHDASFFGQWAVPMRNLDHKEEE